jgi:hypothetical protein
VKVLLPRLSTATIRKCLLSASSERGRWVHLLVGNSRLLFNKPIVEEESLQFQSQWFYMNDGPNVKIENALGVVLLELGLSWELVLQKECPYRESAVDLLREVLELDNEMVFFRSRFVGILPCLGGVLSGEGDDRKGERICSKIYQILAKLPEDNYQIYAYKAKEEHPKVEKGKNYHYKIPNKQQNVV